MKKLAVIILLVALSVSNFANAQQTLEITAPFTQIALKGPLRVEFIPDEEYKTLVTLYGIEPGRLNWQSKGSLLTIALRTGYLEKEGYAVVQVHYKNIESISCEGATITNSETLVADKLSILTLGSVNKIQLDIAVQDLEVNTSGRSDILLTGSAKWANLRSILGSRIDCMQMDIADVLAISNQGSEIYVNASQRLDARAGSGGNIYYLGNPRLKTKSTLGGGVVSVEPSQSGRKVIVEDLSEDVDPDDDI